MQDFSWSSIYLSTGLWQCIVIKYPPLSDKPLTASAELCCTFGDMYSQKGTFNISLFQLHWLSLRFRSLYKILFHTFKVVSGTAPLWLSDVILKYILVRMLRSDFCSLLTVSKSHTTIYGEKSFRASSLRPYIIIRLIILNLHQIKNYFVKFLKLTYWN